MFEPTLIGLGIALVLGTIGAIILRTYDVIREKLMARKGLRGPTDDI